MDNEQTHFEGETLDLFGLIKSISLLAACAGTMSSPRAETEAGRTNINCSKTRAWKLNFLLLQKSQLLHISYLSFNKLYFLVSDLKEGGLGAYALGPSK